MKSYAGHTLSPMPPSTLLSSPTSSVGADNVAAGIIGAASLSWRCVGMFIVLLSVLSTPTSVVRANDYGLPTEVVEEWGCHDTELRLTCGRLDATIAILEATYTPNCTGQPDDDACIHMDFKKLTRSYSASPRVDAHLTETEAGRQFLETLQRHRIEAERTAAAAAAAAKNPAELTLISAKNKRNSMRDTLEMLIVDYLRELSPGDHHRYGDTEAAAPFMSQLTDDGRKRQRRSARQSDDDYYEPPRSSSASAGDTNNIAGGNIDHGDDNGDGNETLPVVVNDLRKIEIGSRNITVVPAPQRNRSHRRGGGHIGRTSECAAFRRHVTKLDQYELDKALMRNGESRELNVRRVLNHRCSGKNHCSFVFSADYPFSILWHDGIVRIKYICMNNFRLNKFCDERLHIGNEPEPTLLPTSAEPPKGEPVAEARIQTDQSFHNLKILKSDSVPDLILGSIGGARTTAPQPTDGDEASAKRRKPSRIYSQDFKFFKILPSSAKSTNRTAAGMTEEMSANEIYLKVDPKLATVASSDGMEVAATSTTFTHNAIAIPTANSPKVSEPDTTTEKIPTSSATTRQRPSTATTTITTTIAHVIETTTTTTTTTTTETTKDRTPKSSVTNHISQLDIDSYEHETEGDDHDNDIDADDAEDDNDVEQISNHIEHDADDGVTKSRYSYNGQYVVLATTPMPTTTADAEQSPPDNQYDDEDDRSYEDYAVESFGRTVVRKNKVRIHTSYQLPAYANVPLRQGFLASTGYPAYYIGESNCSWTLVAPRGHRVRLTVLDLNLRVDDVGAGAGGIDGDGSSGGTTVGSSSSSDRPQLCRDRLEIVDQNSVIFDGCQELAKPMQIVSDSNEIRVTLRTTSRLAYPKRGVLLHYTALGCLLLPVPANVRLVLAARDTARYVCLPAFVFADTRTASRELHCNEHYTWDRTLPDCVAQHQLQPKAIAAAATADRIDVRHNHSLLNHQRPRTSSTLSTKMADKTTDMLYDVAIPSMIIAGLFLVNVVVFVVIMRYRNKRKNENDFDSHEMSRL